jgi:hypothetical protein
MIIAMAGLAGTLASGLFCLWRWYFITVTFGPALVARMVRPALWAALGSALLALLALTASRRRSGAVIVYENGLLLEQGGRRRWIPWSDIMGVRIRAVRYGLPSISWGSRTCTILDLISGPQVRLPGGLDGFPDLIETIKQAVYPRLADGFRQAINQGQEVGFGPVKLTPLGILVRGRKLLRWQDLSGPRLQGGQLLLPAMKGRPIRVPVEQVPNADLCFQFIQQLGQNP